jgi:hypothetical protein
MNLQQRIFPRLGILSWHPKRQLCSHAEGGYRKCEHGNRKDSVVFNKLRATWNYLWVEDGQRKSRKLAQLDQCTENSRKNFTS